MTWQLQAVGDKATVLKQLAGYEAGLSYEPDVEALVVRDFVVAALKQTQDTEHYEVHYVVDCNGHRDRQQLSMNLSVRPIHMAKAQPSQPAETVQL